MNHKFLVLLAMAAIAAPAQDFKTVTTFKGKNGAHPGGALMQAINGDLYSTTEGVQFIPMLKGLVFKVTPAGVTKTVADLTGFALAGLVQDSHGDFYGTTSGSSNRSNIFKMTGTGTISTLYIFCETKGCPDGGDIESPLIQGSDGKFYGTTSLGGSNGKGGTVFQITTAGTLTTLYNFCTQTNCADGSSSYAPLVEASDGNFYGTTKFGGNTYCDQGCGTIFKITPAGTMSTLYSFCAQAGCPDSATPVGGLMQAADGNLWGTTFGDGVDGFGTVFKIGLDGTLTTVYTFCQQAGCADGGTPTAGLMQASDGNFYGTTTLGSGGFGTVFQLTPAGSLTTLHTFCTDSTCSDGIFPYSPLIQGTDGNIYGTTYGGAGHGLGTVFELSMGLPSNVAPLRNLGAASSAVTILGTKLTGATKVTFNGVAATKIKVNSTGTALTTSVPHGATSGILRVVTPGGTLSSNEPFQVIR